MARIFSSEKLSLNGDNIRIRSTNANEFEITDSTETSVLLSRSGIESDFSSLNAQDTKNESDLSVDVSSLSAQDTKNESDLSVDVSSLNAQDTKNESDLSVDVSSLMAEIDATNTNITANDVVAVEGTPSSGDGSLYIDFGDREFESNALPSVSVTMVNGAGDPIIGAMITEIATTGVTVAFSDDLPSANYKVKILASI